MTADVDVVSPDGMTAEIRHVTEKHVYVYHDRECEMRDKVGIMPLLRFAHAAQSGLDTSDFEGLAAMYDMLQGCFTEAGFAQFQDEAVRQADGAEELLGVVQDVIALLSARPSGPPSVSPPGPTPTGGSSEADSTWRAYERVADPEHPRPDLAYVIYQNAKTREMFSSAN